ncbi:MAG: enolase C-terminal domain-like protein, partial [Abditibacteriaceae bacterium]
MRIQSVEVFRLALPLLTPWRTAYGEDQVIEPILVRLGDGNNFGWGESSPLSTPNYSPESARTAYIVARDFLSPVVLGQDISSGEELQDRFSVFKGNFFAKAAFDTAWWDLHAKHQKMPLWRVLGGENPVVESGADFGVMDNISLLLKEIEKSQEQGFARVKLKYSPSWGMEMLRQVRAAFPDTVFHVDCNGAYTLDDLPMLQRLDEFNLAMIEQPLKYDDLI